MGGRGLWAAGKRLAWLSRLVSGLAVAVLVVGVPLVWGWYGQASRVEEHSVFTEPSYTLGLTQEGEQIENIFAYDCSGAPLTGVQLFDQQGRPITTVQGRLSDGGEPASGWDEEAQRSIVYLQSEYAAMPDTWNVVFPLREARLAVSEDWAGAERAAEDPEPPFAEVPQLGSSCPTAGTADEAQAGEDASDETSGSEG